MKLKKRFRFAILLIAILLIANLGNIGRLIYPVKYMNYIKSSAETYNIDPYLIMSIIKSESNFDQEAVSHKSATGLMQIMEPTANWLAEKMDLSDFDYSQITDPELNIKMGCYYINYLLNSYDGNVQNALAAYNAGQGTVNEWLKNKAYSEDGKTLTNIPYPETRTYVRRIETCEKMYRLLYKIRSEKLV